MILITSIISMILVYYYMDRGLAIGFLFSLFMEIIALVTLYKMLQKSEIRTEKKYTNILAGYKQREEKYKKYIENIKGEKPESYLKSEDLNEEDTENSRLYTETNDK